MTFAGRINAVGHAELLIHQWRESARMQGLTQALLDVVDRHIVQPLVELEGQTRLDSADGIWLDYIGERLGLGRPATDATDYAFFGFDGSSGVGFGQGPLVSAIEALSPRVPAGDDYYRRLLTMRAVMLLGDGSVASMEEAIGHLFPGAEYQDNLDMTATLLGVPADDNLRTVVESTDAWPSVAGVTFAEEE